LAGLADGDAVGCAVSRWQNGTAPPLRAAYVSMARDNVALAVQLGTASTVLKAIHHALTSEEPVAARIEKKPGARMLVLTGPNEPFAKALRREGSVVVTDANAEVNAPIYASSGTWGGAIVTFY
jgi:hypothetical protein